MVHHNTNRARITNGLVFDIFTVLDNHGFQGGDDQALGTAVSFLSDMVEGYEGRIDSLRRPRTEQNENGGR